MHIKYLITRLFKPEERTKNCEKYCHSDQLHTTCNHIKKLPDIFIVQLKRYYQSPQNPKVIKKHNSSVIIPEVLNFDKDTM